MRAWQRLGLALCGLLLPSILPAQGPGAGQVRSPWAANLGAVTVQTDKPSAVTFPHPTCLYLGTPEGLQVAFDLLEQPSLALSYRLRLYDLKGQPAPLPTSAYITGFADGLLDPPQASAGTLQRYDHYELRLPELGRRLLLSGNYRLEIYLTDSPEEVLLSIPFLVCEASALRPTATVVPRPLGPGAEHFQGVDLRLTWPSSLPLRPEELRAVVLQNDRWEQTVELSRPSYAAGGELRFEGERGARFEGGNTYLKLEHLTDRAVGLGVETCLPTDSGTLLILPLHRGGEVAPFRPDPAYQGLQRLRSLATEEIDTEGEYHWVRFRFAAEALPEGEILLAGEAFRYLPEEQRRLDYDPKAGCYQRELRLKSGYQEYQYLFRPLGAASLSSRPTVGSHWQTANGYTILIYLRGVRAGHDRLVAFLPL